MSNVRVRFAPSPTGYMHIGNLRTALYEYLIARMNNGSFILRIEDTDQERYVEGAVDVIYKTLKMAGLKHDEGPDIGGDYGPYVQSERRHTYAEYAKKLVELGGAYYCFCTKERLHELKEKNEAEGVANKYDRCCLQLSKEEIEEKIKSGIPYVVRQKMPDAGTTSFCDGVYGTITVENAGLDDQVLVKSDGLPTYNFANVVDDHLMGITHVVRGSEYLSSTPKYNLLYEAFGWDIPMYLHLPPVMKSATKKYSKREGDASFEELIERGYLVEAVINYIALLGWSPGGNQEVFTLSELEKVFSIDGLSKSPAIF
ncbi:MAG TPA: glutamate--tRNA ligase, partial [Clostridia bacterium]